VGFCLLFDFLIGFFKEKNLTLKKVASGLELRHEPYNFTGFGSKIEEL